MKIIRKRTFKSIALLQTASLLLGLSAFTQSQPKTNPKQPDGAQWQTDWKRFGKELATIYADPNYELTAISDLVNSKFSDKEVVWSGTVKSVEKPNSKKKNGSIVVTMPLCEVVSRSGSTAKLDSLTLQPSDVELDSWKEVKPGNRVVFQTRISKANTNDYFPVIHVFAAMAGEYKGQVLVIVRTTGGKMLRSATEQTLSEEGKRDK